MTDLHALRQICLATGPRLEGIAYGTTLRQGGCSEGACDSLNLALHVNDQTAHVLQNRALIQSLCGRQPHWLSQTHSAIVFDPSQPDTVQYNERHEPIADAAVTDSSQDVLAVLTADCLPVVLADTQRRIIAVAHGGWRGVLNGILQNTIAAMRRKQAQVDFAWIGPSISAAVFEVGVDVYQSFVQQDDAFAQFFKPIAPEVDFYACLAQQPLRHPWSQASAKALSSLSTRLWPGTAFKVLKSSPQLATNAIFKEQDVVFYDDLISDGAVSGATLEVTKYLFDLAGAASYILQGAGVTQVFRSDLCTYLHNDCFFSHRRSAQQGRMATLVWLQT
ncbi:polyphenol oxidase family protein [Brackiella oedipodis]|uniref:polyphenol oxidase family protein n=1 Tax=Brackiella oedipodis TaxID=124225 RepID=UPI000686A88F|nr:polyphenol oxidase family protein [Brackiella oedipodis]